MQLNEYQARAAETAVYPHRGTNLPYTALGLAGEAGEVANEVKKVMRDDGGKLTPTRAEKILDELGDVLWYLSQAATEAGSTLEDVAQHNLQKLAARKANRTLQGSGDNR